MRCAKCFISVLIKPLLRVNPIGEKGIFWCNDCLKKHEPELSDNLREDETPIIKALKQILYNKK